MVRHAFRPVSDTGRVQRGQLWTIVTVERGWLPPIETVDDPSLFRARV